MLLLLEWLAYNKQLQDINLSNITLIEKVKKNLAYVKQEEINKMLK